MNAASASRYCAEWLADLCRQVDRVRLAVVVLPGKGAGYVPVAIWPDMLCDPASLVPLVERALGESRRLAESVAADGASPGEMRVAYPLIADGSPAGAVAVALEGGADARAAERVLQTIAWGAGWLDAVLLRQHREADATRLQRATLALDLVAAVNETRALDAALAAAADRLAAGLACRRVLAGVPTRRGVSLVAMSGRAEFDRTSRDVRSVESAMDETLDHGASLAVSDDAPDRAAAPAHAALARKVGGACLLSVVLPGDVAVLVFERTAGCPFDTATRQLCEALAALLAPLVAAKPRPSSWPGVLDAGWARLRARSAGVAAYRRHSGRLG